MPLNSSPYTKFDNSSFAGLCITKKLPASEGSSNAKIMLNLSYIDPKADSGDGIFAQDLVAIATRLSQILNLCDEDIISRYEIGESRNLSCAQQITDCDCGFIMAQNLIDLAASKTEFTCPNYQSDPDQAILQIAKLRQDFVNPEMMGEENAYDYLITDMLDMLKNQRYERVNDYIKSTSIEELPDAGLTNFAEIFHQLKKFHENGSNELELREYLKANIEECKKLLANLEYKIIEPVICMTKEAIDHTLKLHPDFLKLNYPSKRQLSDSEEEDGSPSRKRANTDSCDDKSLFSSSMKVNSSEERNLKEEAKAEDLFSKMILTPSMKEKQASLQNELSELEQNLPSGFYDACKKYSSDYKKTFKFGLTEEEKTAPVKGIQEMHRSLHKDKLDIALLYLQRLIEIKDHREFIYPYYYCARQEQQEVPENITNLISRHIDLLHLKQALEQINVLGNAEELGGSDA